MLKIIENHPNYAVSKDGSVFRIRTGKYYTTLIPDITANGYKRVDLDGKKEYVARLVLEAFDPKRNPNDRVFYIDGDKLNCKLSNLVWLSPSDIQLYSSYTIEYRLRTLSRARE